MTPHRFDFLGCPVDPWTTPELLADLAHAIRTRARKCVIHFVNGNKIAQTSTDSEMRDILWRGDYVLVDGQPLLPMARMLGLRVPERIDGIGLMGKLVAMAEQNRFSVYLLGARQEILEACVRTLQQRHPALMIAGYRNGYFKEADIPAVVEQVNATKPDILFIGIGTPIKERFADRWRSQLHPVVIQGVGGSFDVMAGLVKRAPIWIQRLGMEWLYRVLQEPRRMFWRYFKTNVQCLWVFAKALAARWLGIGRPARPSPAGPSV